MTGEKVHVIIGPANDFSHDEIESCISCIFLQISVNFPYSSAYRYLFYDVKRKISVPGKASSCVINRGCVSLVPRPLPDFILQLWIHDWPGNKATNI